MGLKLQPYDKRVAALVATFDIVGGGDDIISQISYNIPSITILGLALSIVFRRKGMSKTGFFMQFIGVVLFVLYMVIVECILSSNVLWILVFFNLPPP